MDGVGSLLKEGLQYDKAVIGHTHGGKSFYVTLAIIKQMLLEEANSLEKKFVEVRRDGDY